MSHSLNFLPVLSHMQVLLHRVLQTLATKAYSRQLLLYPSMAGP